MEANQLRNLLAPNNVTGQSDGLRVGEVGDITEDNSRPLSSDSRLDSLLVLPDESGSNQILGGSTREIAIVLDDTPALQASGSPVLGYQRHMRLDVVVGIERDVRLIEVNDESIHEAASEAGKACGRKVADMVMQNLGY